MTLLYLAIGIAIGALIGWLLKAKSQANTASTVSIELYNDQNVQLKLKDKELLEVTSSLAKAEQWAEDLGLKLKEQKGELEKLQGQFKTEMQNLSNSILEDKSKRFLEMNEKRMGEILNPLKEKIKDFEQKVDTNSKDAIKWNTELKEQLKSLSLANLQIAEDANSLAKALKGDKKMQGNWGEMQLEQILEKAGLVKDVHYRKEVSLANDEGKLYRPDFIINLPDDKHLVIDSKVSLVAYEQYYNAADDAEMQGYLKNHVQALHNHINGLGSKNYQHLHGINSPNYILLFVPIEPALYVALKEDLSLYEKAIAANIVLVSTSTLLATLRTVSYIWKQENQTRNVIEIAKESGALYDKFVGFITDLENVGKRLTDAQSDYNEAMKKLHTSPKKATTIIGRIEKLKELGAETNKQIDSKYLE